MIKNYSNRNYINSVKAWGAESSSPKNNKWVPILIGVTVSVASFAIYLHARQQQLLLLLRMNLTEANNKILAMQREKEMLAAENFAISTLDETAEQVVEQDNAKA
jgi:hypothetical protein